MQACTGIAGSGGLNELRIWNTVLPWEIPDTGKKVLGASETIDEADG